MTNIIITVVSSLTTNKTEAGGWRIVDCAPATVFGSDLQDGNLFAARAQHSLPTIDLRRAVESTKR